MDLYKLLPTNLFEDLLEYNSSLFTYFKHHYRKQTKDYLRRNQLTQITKECISRCFYTILKKCHTETVFNLMIYDTKLLKNSELPSFKLFNNKKTKVIIYYNTDAIYYTTDKNYNLEGTKSTFLKCNIYKLNCNKNKK